MSDKEKNTTPEGGFLRFIPGCSMLTATRQRRITYILAAVTILYLLLLIRARYHDPLQQRFGHLRAKPIKLINTVFGLNMSTSQYYQSTDLYIPKCFDLVRDNQNVMQDTQNFLKIYKQRLTDNEFYIKEALDCPNFIKKYNFSESYHETPLRFPTAYIITAHSSVQQFNILMHSLYNEHNVYCVHVDNSSTPEFKKAIDGVVNCLPNVFVATKWENMVYNDHSELRAEFHCLRDLLSLPTHWKYVINLDETSFPLQTNTDITDTLKKLGDYNMIEGKVKIPDDRYIRYKYRHIPVDGKLVQTQEPKDVPPPNIDIHTGAPYYALTRDFVHFILSNYYATEFYNWLNGTYAPRELFWGTMNQIYMRQENLTPMGFHSTHYYIPRTRDTGEVAGDYACPGKFERNYCVFGTASLPMLVSRKELFAARFDISFDHVPLVCLDSTVTSPYIYSDKIEPISPIS